MTSYAAIRRAVTPGTLIRVTSSRMPVQERRVLRTTGRRWYFETTFPARWRGQIEWDRAAKVTVTSPTSWTAQYANDRVTYEILPGTTT